MDEDLIISSTEIIKDKLYFATLEEKYTPKSTKNSKYFQIENKFVYENFYNDFGPYHLCHLYLFCMKLNTMLSNASGRVIFYTSDVAALRLNAAYLIGSYAVIYLKKSPTYIHNLLTGSSEWELLNFRDASGGPPLFQISLLDVLQGVQKAHEAKFFDFTSFNSDEYQFYEKVVNGDLNWIIPDKMLAFSGPHNTSQIKDGYPLHAPDHYHKYFNDNNVTTIVRLNKKSYSAKQFTDYGFEHYDLFFIDGSSPSDAIVNKFINICERAKGGVAVHCKAGLGRTGSLIACYMMKHYGFTARQSIAWLRICRPGSVIGHQQKFLENIQARMLAEGEAYRKRLGINAIPKSKFGIYSMQKRNNTILRLSDEDVENANVPDSLICESSDDTCDGLSSDNAENNLPRHAVCRIAKIGDHTQASHMKAGKEDFVTLDSIINSNTSPMETRSSSQQRAKNNSALAMAKTTYNSNKSNYIMSAANCVKPASLVKVQTTYSAKKLQMNASNAVPKSPTFGSSKSASGSPIKSCVKGQFPKNALHSQRANLARNHGQGFMLNSANPLKAYTRKGGSLKTKLNQDNFNEANSTSSITTLTESCSLNNKNYDSNLNITLEAACRPSVCNTNSLPTKLGGSGTRKKAVTRTSSVIRKKAQKTSISDQNRDFRMENAINSNSDSERDSTNTTITNISVDSLENIPCKMVTRREKSQSPEPMDQSLDNVDEGVNSQGTKLYKIKAKRLQMFSKNQSKKEGIITRSLSSSPGAKKK